MSEGGWSRPGATGAILYAVAAGVVSGLLAVFTRLRIAHHRGRRRVAHGLPDGAIIVIANHASHVDGLLLAIVCRRMGRPVRILATAGVFRAPVIGGIARRIGFIPVERGSNSAGDALAPAAAALAAGEAVGIFPEGRTTRDPNAWPERAKTGAVRLALSSGAPIVPIAMVGTHRVLGRSGRITTLLRNIVLRPRVETEIGPAIDVSQLTEQVEPDADELRRIADEVMARLIDLVEVVRGEIAPDPIGVEPTAD